MNVVVCIKQVPDIEGSIEIDHETNSTKSPNLVVNSLDVLAVEEAQRIKEQKGKSQVTIICMGSSFARKALRSCLSMGADQALLLCDPMFDNSDSYSTGLILAKAISLQQYDLILCGQMAADTMAGQVGSIIAEILQIPLVTGVVKIDFPTGSSKLVLYRKIEGGNRETVETATPAVITVENGLNKPRYPSLRSIKDAETKSIVEYDLEALGLSAKDVGANSSMTKVFSISPAKPMLGKLFVPESSLPATKRIYLLMGGGITEKKVDLVSGSPKEAALSFVQFVAERKFI